MTIPEVEPRHPRGVRRRVPPTAAEQLDAFAQRAATDSFETLLPDIRKVVDAVIAAQGYVCWWHVRLGLYDVGKILGTEVIRAAGTFARRCGLVAKRDSEGGIKSERPNERYNKVFSKSHANRHTCYGWPTSFQERATKLEQESR